MLISHVVKFKLMSEQTDNIENLLRPFGLLPEEISIYLYLLDNSFTTALIISRELHIGRTRAYRILDKLIAKQLVEQRVKERGFQFGATHPSKFSFLLKEREHEIKLLKESLPNILQHLEKKQKKQSEDTKILYYKGLDGLKQITYNSTKAVGELFIYEVALDMSNFLPKSFSEEMRREFVKNKIHVRELTLHRKINDWTEVTTFAKSYWQARFLNPKHFSPSIETLIYNDVYVMYSWKDDNIFGVEIYNKDLAAMQKALFTTLWQQAKPLKVINKFGAAELV